jgi:hypothetical protein
VRVCAAQNEVPDNWLKSSRRAYVADWDNQAWAANLMLAELTHAQVYRERVRELLGIWLYGDAVPSVSVISGYMSPIGAPMRPVPEQVFSQTLYGACCSAPQLRSGHWPDAHSWPCSTRRMNRLAGALTPQSQDPSAGLPEDVLLNGRQFENFTVKNDDGTNATFEIIPKCIPTQTFEKYCFDGIDDDCNGYTDREDLAVRHLRRIQCVLTSHNHHGII